MQGKPKRGVSDLTPPGAARMEPGRDPRAPSPPCHLPPEAAEIRADSPADGGQSSQPAGACGRRSRLRPRSTGGLGFRVPEHPEAANRLRDLGQTRFLPAFKRRGGDRATLTRKRMPGGPRGGDLHRDTAGPASAPPTAPDPCRGPAARPRSGPQALPRASGLGAGTGRPLRHGLRGPSAPHRPAVPTHRLGQRQAPGAREPRQHPDHRHVRPPQRRPTSPRAAPRLRTSPRPRGGRVGAPRLRKGDGVGAAPAQRGPGDRGARASHIWRSPPGGRSGVGQRAGPGPEPGHVRGRARIRPAEAPRLRGGRTARPGSGQLRAQASGPSCAGFRCGPRGVYFSCLCNF